MAIIRLLFAAAAIFGLVQGAAAQQTMLITVVLRHDQTKTVDEINAHLDKTGFRKIAREANIEPQ